MSRKPYLHTIDSFVHKALPRRHPHHSSANCHLCCALCKDVGLLKGDEDVVWAQATHCWKSVASVAAKDDVCTSIW